MAAIEYGLDNNGEKVSAEDAYSHYTYKCPHCSEPIVVRKCTQCVDYFAHKTIAHRTPQQMMCPGYTGNGEYQKIEDKIDKVYIANGGIPVYLCKCSNDNYQLNACFPPISKGNMDLLQKWNVKVVISDGNRKEEYSAWHVPHYRIKSLSPWIKIKCKNVQYQIKEVKRKWEWGIIGLNCENDLFHSHIEGGFRVALHSNVILKKEYLIISNGNYVPFVQGVTFSYKGFANINSNTRNYKVYSMIIEEPTREAIAYIRNKGHQLIAQNDDIIPIWPPCVIQGKELIYRKQDERAYLYHHGYVKQTLHSIRDNEIIKIPECADIIQCDTGNETILLRDTTTQLFSDEIRVILTHGRGNFQNIVFLRPEVECRNRKGEDDIFVEEKGRLSMRPDALLENVTFESNIERKTVCLLNNSYVLLSTPKVLKHISHNQQIIISVEPFGKIVIGSAHEISSISKTNLLEGLGEVVEQLCRCHSASIEMGNAYDKIIFYAKNNCFDLYKILMTWKESRQIPQAAIKILSQLQEVIRNA